MEIVRTTQEKEKAKSWVFSIAHNEINKYFRELGKQNMEEPLEIDRKEYIDNSINPEYLCIEKIKNKEELLILAKAMEELPGKYREVLVLWSQGKLTEKEIAVVLDMNYSTVRVMVHRGLEKLRKLYFDIERRERDEAR